MDKYIHPNYIKASNLIFGTVALGILNFFFSSDLLNTGKNIAIAVLTLVFIAALGLLVRQGKDWVKYLLLVLTIFGLLSIPFVINTLAQNPVVGFINIAQTIMEIWAIVLLFKIPKTADNNVL